MKPPIAPHDSARLAGASLDALSADPPLVQANAITKVFDVSAPWLNRMIEGRPRQDLLAVEVAPCLSLILFTFPLCSYPTK